MGQSYKDEGDDRNSRRMPINPALLVSDAGSNATPIHCDDVTCKKQKDNRQNETAGIHAISPNHWSSADVLGAS